MSHNEYDSLLIELAEIRSTLQTTRGFEDPYEDAVVILCDIVASLAAKLRAVEEKAQ